MAQMAIEFMEFTHDDKTRFEPFFQAPSIDRLQIDPTSDKVSLGLTPEMLHKGLTPTEFERFLGYMFYSAGFNVENVSLMRMPRGPGVDLNVYQPTNPRKVYARIEARRYDPDGNGITLEDVLKFAGTLVAAGNVPGYLITTASFPANARQIANRPGMQNVHLVDGATLLRYITYIYGSRVNNGQGFHRTLQPILPGWLFNTMSTEPRTTARIITVANNKGGVGKSTTALNVGFALSSMGKRVLLVDLDGQANLTLALPPRESVALRQRRIQRQTQPPRAPQLHERSITEHFSAEQTPLPQLVQPTRFENIWVLPADEELSRIEPGGSARPDAELLFAHQLRDPWMCVPAATADAAPTDPSRPPQPFDFIIVDTPPAQSHFSRIALAAADYALVPLRADSFSVAGINRALTATRTMQALTGASMGRGLLLTQWREVRSMRDIQAKLNVDTALLGYPMFDAIVPYDDHIEQAHISLISGGIRNVFGWRTSGAATAYRKVTEELMRRLGEKQS